MQDGVNINSTHIPAYFDYNGNFGINEKIYFGHTYQELFNSNEITSKRFAVVVNAPITYQTPTYDLILTPCTSEGSYNNDFGVIFSKYQIPNTSYNSLNLSVIGNIKTTNDLIIQNYSNRENQFIFQVNNKGNTGKLELFGKEVDESKKLITFWDDGKIEIGSIKPGIDYKLAVEGTLLAKEVRVTQSCWYPDFVFSNNYKLKSLKELKLFIDEYKHLPGIPLEKTIKKEGLDIGELSVKLLQKVEELTLYSINQEEKIELLTEENIRLNKTQNNNSFLFFIMFSAFLFIIKFIKK